MTVPPTNSHASSEAFVPATHHIDTPRPMRVAVIGCGFSGINAAIRLKNDLQNAQLVVYEKNTGVGGTWLENKYPGVACDIAAAIYQLSFTEHTQWSAYHAPGSEILGYLEKTASDYDLHQHIKLQHEMTGANWNEERSKWKLYLKRHDTGAVVQDEVDVVLSCTGALNTWKWPDIEGLHGFKGQLAHSASWNESLQWEGKRVAVIGSGSSALQIVPTMQKTAAHIDNYVRGKTWISPPLSSLYLKEKGAFDAGNYAYTKEDLKRFRDDPETHWEHRRFIEREGNTVHPFGTQGSPAQQAAVAAFTERMRGKLTKKPWIAEKIIPDFPVGCRRVTPGPGYLEALCEDNADLVYTGIERITPTGIKTVDGQTREYDMIVCATGFDTTFRPRVPIIGRNGANLQDKWATKPTSYMSLAVDDIPNWFITFGPNSGLASGNLIVLLEYTTAYAIDAIKKMQKEHLKWMVPSSGAVRDFDEYCQTYFKKTVFSSTKCRSWYKMGTAEGPVAALWPGSMVHGTFMLSNPRWEDWEYGSLFPRNRFAYGGDGWTQMEEDGIEDTSFYIGRHRGPAPLAKVPVKR